MGKQALLTRIDAQKLSPDYSIVVGCSDCASDKPCFVCEYKLSARFVGVDVFTFEVSHPLVMIGGRR